MMAQWTRRWNGCWRFWNARRRFMSRMKSNFEGHDELAVQAACEAITLLKNERDVCPFSLEAAAECW